MLLNGSCRRSCWLVLLAMVRWSPDHAHLSCCCSKSHKHQALSYRMPQAIHPGLCEPKLVVPRGTRQSIGTLWNPAYKMFLSNKAILKIVRRAFHNCTLPCNAPQQSDRELLSEEEELNLCAQRCSIRSLDQESRTPFNFAGGSCQFERAIPASSHSLVEVMFCTRSFESRSNVCLDNRTQRRRDRMLRW